MKSSVSLCVRMNVLFSEVPGSRYHRWLEQHFPYTEALKTTKKKNPEGSFLLPENELSLE